MSEVHVWRIENAAPDATLLSPDERAAAERFAGPLHRERYLAHHAAVRRILASYAQVDPRALRFGKEARGKPFLIGSELEFSLSHCDGTALLAVARGIPLGIDLEKLDAPIDPEALHHLVLAADERPLARDKRGFLRIWCRKEACLKAIGVGLLDDLTSLSVAGDRAGGAHLQDLHLEGFAAALATLGQPASILIRN